MAVENFFAEGVVVQIVRENTDADLPDEVPSHARLENHGLGIGGTFVIGNPETDYDPADNSWLLKMANGKKGWVHEGALEDALPPVTEEEENEAMASIMKALGS